MENTKLRQFSSFIKELRNGSVDEELSQALASVVKEVKKTQKSGAVELKIKLVPNKGEDTLFVQAVINDKPPKSEPPSNIFYIDDKFNLRREDPRQMNFGDLKTAGQEETSTTTKEV